MKETKTLLPPYIVERCPKCQGFLLEGRLPKGTYIQTICTRCKPPKGKERPRIIIER